MNAAGEDEVSKRTRSPIKSRMKTILGLGGRNLHRLPHSIPCIIICVDGNGRSTLGFIHLFIGMGQSEKFPRPPENI